MKGGVTVTHDLLFRQVAVGIVASKVSKNQLLIFVGFVGDLMALLVVVVAKPNVRLG